MARTFLELFFLTCTEPRSGYTGPMRGVSSALGTGMMFAALGLLACQGGAKAPPEPEVTQPVANAPEAPEPAEPAASAACVYGDSGDPAAGCPHGEPDQGAPASGDGGHFGAPFSRTGPATLASTLPDASDQPTDVLVSGTIDRVCQKRGCWMVLKEGEHSARVLMKNHAFTVPMDSKGKSAVVEGTLKVRTFSVAQAKHLAQDGGEDPSKVNEERREYVLMASAVEIES